jgi:hypothetical protein
MVIVGRNYNLFLIFLLLTYHHCHFHHHGVEEESIPKTAFGIRMGKFEFLVIPFRLTNTPATFQTIINSILQLYLEKLVIIYIDNIIVFSDSVKEHEKHLELVLPQMLRY